MNEYLLALTTLANAVADADQAIRELGAGAGEHDEAICTTEHYCSHCRAWNDAKGRHQAANTALTVFAAGHRSPAHPDAVLQWEGHVVEAAARAIDPAPWRSNHPSAMECRAALEQTAANVLATAARATAYGPGFDAVTDDMVTDPQPLDEAQKGCFWCDDTLTTADFGGAVFSQQPCSPSCSSPARH